MSDPFEHPLVAEVYDSIPNHQTRPDVSFYTKLATESAGSVLELGSGTGRVLNHIAKAGKKIVGLEASEHMLRRCHKNLAAASPNVSDNVELFQGQMQRFFLKSRFGLVICPFNSFLHLLSVQEQLSCLTHVHEHLVPGGKFAFDVFDPDIRRMASAHFTEEGSPRRFELPTGSKVELRFRNKSVDFLKQRIDSEISFDITHRDGRREHVSHPVRQRYLFRYEAEHLLERCGYEVEALYSDFQGSPYGTVHTGLLVFVAKKR